MAGRKLLTLVLPRREGEVLLGMKKRGFGCGRWNGFGGKVEAGETVEQAAVREVREECGLEVLVEDLRPAGTIHFEFVGEPVQLEVHVFQTAEFQGTVVETEEMAPRWWPELELPFHLMWPDDEYWFPLLLEWVHACISNCVFLVRQHVKPVNAISVLQGPPLRGFLPV
jgi:8-oxo-dGTP diphosphatase/2-hydroxy-dATP diphosphatase